MNTTFFDAKRFHNNGDVMILFTIKARDLSTIKTFSIANIRDIIKKTLDAKKVFNTQTSVSLPIVFKIITTNKENAMTDVDFAIFLARLSNTALSFFTGSWVGIVANESFYGKNAEDKIIVLGKAHVSPKEDFFPCCLEK